MTLALELFWALAGSRAIRYALAACLAFGGYQGWKYHQQHEGAQKAIAKIEKKAAKNVKTAEAVRDAVAAGGRGMRDPWRRP